MTISYGKEAMYGFNAFWEELAMQYTQQQQQQSGDPNQPNTGGIISDGFKQISGFFDTLGITIGDNVPNWPINSTRTFNKIVNDLKSNFPPPTSVDNAQELLAKLDLWIESNRTQQLNDPDDGPKQTYDMMQKQLQAAYFTYLKTGVFAYPNWTIGAPPANSLGNIMNAVTGGSAQTNPFIPDYLQPKRDNSTTIIIAIIIAAIILFLILRK